MLSAFAQTCPVCCTRSVKEPGQARPGLLPAVALLRVKCPCLCLGAGLAHRVASEGEPCLLFVHPGMIRRSRRLVLSAFQMRWQWLDCAPPFPVSLHPLPLSCVRPPQWLSSRPLLSPVLPPNVTPAVWCPSAHPVRYSAANGAAGQPNDPGECWYKPGKGIMAR